MPLYQKTRFYFKKRNSLFNWKKSLLLIIPLILILSIFSDTQFGENIENEIARKIEFGIRKYLKKDPELSSRIKIYALGDSTASYLNSDDLTLKEWANLLKSFETFKPRAVFIDKIFALPSGLENAAAFQQILKSLSYPVIVGGFVTYQKIANRPTLSLEYKDFELLPLMEELPNWIKEEEAFIYGPNIKIQEAFHHIGSINAKDGYFFTPFVIPEQEKIFRAAPFYLADKIHLYSDEYEIDGVRLKTDKKGRNLVNWISPDKFIPKTFALKSVLEKIKNKSPLFPIIENSVIVVLPGMTTGNTDVLAGPFGLHPGGYRIISLINSILEKNWLGRIENHWALAVVSATLSIIIGFLFDGAVFWFLSSVFLFLHFGLGLHFFVNKSTELPWFYLTVNFMLVQAVLIYNKFQLHENNVKRIRVALEGNISNQRLREMIKVCSEIDLKPQTRYMTIMFVDVVGFSKTVMEVPPQEAFAQLKELLVFISKTVHRFGGTVDKSMGDGVLCFFGYDYGIGELKENHNLQAVRCAIELQRGNIKRTMKNKYTLPLPMRIGIDSGDVIAGDLGNKNRMDLNVIGYTVNMAKRYESACAPYQVMMSEKSRLALGDKTPFDKVEIKKRKIEIKHFADKQFAYELDPFFQDTKSKRIIQEFLSQSISLKKKAS